MTSISSTPVSYTHLFEPTWSHLTLKASYSLTGDRPSVSNAYSIIKAANTWRPSTSTSETQLYLAELANSDLTYEKKHELNIGVSTGFFDNRINIDFDWYRRNNYDLIGIANTQGVGGQIRKFGNIASMKSHGVELSLTTRKMCIRDRYNDVFNDNHIVNFYAGMETNSVDRHSTWFRGWGMQYNLGEIANYAYHAFKLSLIHISNVDTWRFYAYDLS